MHSFSSTTMWRMCPVLWPRMCPVPDLTLSVNDNADSLMHPYSLSGHQHPAPPPPPLPPPSRLSNECLSSLATYKSADECKLLPN